MNPDDLIQLRDDVREIRLALLGNEDVGHVGLVSRVKDHDARLKHIEKYVMYVGGGIAVIAFLFELTKDRFFK
jgi:hypothetical protein